MAGFYLSLWFLRWIKLFGDCFVVVDHVDVTKVQAYELSALYVSWIWVSRERIGQMEKVFEYRSVTTLVLWSSAHRSS